ncbi:hypothetical protein SLEP1_g27672 [Rubroshorea leprosula]|uniref:Uncharacterized protein n=1 Tax=Rubroshorea leprosula TaxID=152421 RepID=A0AAV5K2I7_9ROSI|nr:hypothetical protein SLEP1_g27672 [Rubroshorea leprosula]
MWVHSNFHFFQLLVVPVEAPQFSASSSPHTRQLQPCLLRISSRLASLISEKLID